MPLEQKQVQYFSNCGPQTTFLASKHLLRPAQCYEFDMPALNCEINWKESVFNELLLAFKQDYFFTSKYKK